MIYGESVHLGVGLELGIERSCALTVCSFKTASGHIESCPSRLLVTAEALPLSVNTGSPTEGSFVQEKMKPSGWMARCVENYRLVITSPLLLHLCLSQRSQETVKRVFFRASVTA